jgi:hypothetical protein
MNRPTKTDRRPATLRDYRIDQEGDSKANLKPNEGAKQSVALRGTSSSLTEWTDSAEDLWTEMRPIDLGQSVAVPPVPSKTQPTANNEQALVTQSGQAVSEDLGPTRWAIELALNERRSERQGTVDFSNAYNKQDLLKRLTRESMEHLRKSFQKEIELFNEARKNPSQTMKLYRVSQTADDFMLFRNGVKLVVSGQRAGRIVFAFNQYLGQIFAPNQNPSLEIEAVWGAFDQLHWTHRGERLSIDDLVRYFITEFSRQSFR